MNVTLTKKSIRQTLLHKSISDGLTHCYFPSDSQKQMLRLMGDVLRPDNSTAFFQGGCYFWKVDEEPNILHYVCTTESDIFLFVTIKNSKVKTYVINLNY